MSLSDVQKYIWFKNDINNFKFSCTWFYKRLWIRNVLYIMSGRVFLVQLFISETLLTLSNNAEKCLWFRFVWLVVHLSIRQCVQTLLLFKYREIYICCSYVMQNGPYWKWSTWRKGFVYRDTQKFSDTLRPICEKIL